MVALKESMELELELGKEDNEGVTMKQTNIRNTEDYKDAHSYEQQI